MSAANEVPSPRDVDLRVLYDFEYRTKDERTVAIAEGEKLFLIKKTNPDWWQVIRTSAERPFFVPAKYVELRAPPPPPPPPPDDADVSDRILRDRRKSWAVEELLLELTRSRPQPEPEPDYDTDGKQGLSRDGDEITPDEITPDEIETIAMRTQRDKPSTKERARSKGSVHRVSLHLAIGGNANADANADANANASRRSDSLERLAGQIARGARRALEHSRSFRDGAPGGAVAFRNPAFRRSAGDLLGWPDEPGAESNAETAREPCVCVDSEPASSGCSAIESTVPAVPAVSSDVETSAVTVPGACPVPGIESGVSSAPSVCASVDSSGVTVPGVCSLPLECPGLEAGGVPVGEGRGPAPGCRLSTEELVNVFEERSRSGSNVSDDSLLGRRRERRTPTVSTPPCSSAPLPSDDPHLDSSELKTKLHPQEAEEAATEEGAGLAVPGGWTETLDQDSGLACFVHPSGDKWFTSSDAEGRVYFFEENSTSSSWSLPTLATPPSPPAKPPANANANATDGDIAQGSEGEDSLKRLRQDSNREIKKGSFKELSKNFESGKRRDSFGDVRQDSDKEAKKGSFKELSKGFEKEQRNGSFGDVRQDSNKEATKDSNKTGRKDSYKEGRNDSFRLGRKDSNKEGKKASNKVKEQSKEGSKDTIIDLKTESAKDGKKGSVKESRKDSVKEGRIEMIKEGVPEEGVAKHSLAEIVTRLQAERRKNLASGRAAKTVSMIVPNTAFPEEKSAGSSPPNWPRLFENNTMRVICEGSLQRARLVEQGRKVRKSWGGAYVVLTELFLLFFPDQKHAHALLSGGGAPEPPELCLPLSGAAVTKPPRGVTSRKHALSVASAAAAADTVLLHFDSALTAERWEHDLLTVIHLLPLGEPSLLEAAKKPGTKIQRSKSMKLKGAGMRAAGSVEDLAGADGHSKIRDRLRKFFVRRPTRDALVKKGIYKDEPMFGRLLEDVMSAGQPAPAFVVRCIERIESRPENMAADGLYRVSGNLSQVQRIRLAADQNDLGPLDAEEDVHVVTGALKLFFRELKQPLVPCRLFARALQACSEPSKAERVRQLTALVRALPTANCSTLRFLLAHLLRVSALSSSNRMHIANVAIVFGPTLMWPADSAPVTMATELMQQNLVVEGLLLNFDTLFP